MLVGLGRDGLPPPRQPLRSPWLAWGRPRLAAPTESAETVEIAAGSAGASLLACGDPHTPASRPSGFADVGGTLFFTADDGIHGRELWKSDGTKAGTVLVKDIDPDDDGDDYGPIDLTGVGGRCSSPSTTASTAGSCGSRTAPRRARSWSRTSSPTTTATTSGPSSLTGVGGTLFFTADDGIHGRELWKSDGTKAGTVLVKDIDPDDDGYDESAPPP